MSPINERLYTIISLTHLWICSARVSTAYSTFWKTATRKHRTAHVTRRESTSRSIFWKRTRAASSPRYAVPSEKMRNVTLFLSATSRETAAHCQPCLLSSSCLKHSVEPDVAPREERQGTLESIPHRMTNKENVWLSEKPWRVLHFTYDTLGRNQKMFLRYQLGRILCFFTQPGKTSHQRKLLIRVLQEMVLRPIPSTFNLNAVLKSSRQRVFFVGSGEGDEVLSMSWRQFDPPPPLDSLLITTDEN